MTEGTSSSYITQLDFMVIGPMVKKHFNCHSRRENTVLMNLIIGFYLLHTKSSNQFKRLDTFQRVCNRTFRRIVSVCVVCFSEFENGTL